MSIIQNKYECMNNIHCMYVLCQISLPKTSTSSSDKLLVKGRPEESVPWEGKISFLGGIKHVCGG